MMARAMDKNETGKGVGSVVDRKVVVFNRMVRGSLTEKVTFEPRPEGGAGASHMSTCGKSIRGRRNKCKGS